MRNTCVTELLYSKFKEMKIKFLIIYFEFGFQFLLPYEI